MGEDYNVEEAEDGPRPFTALLDTGLKRTSTGSKVFAALKVRATTKMLGWEHPVTACQAGPWCKVAGVGSLLLLAFAADGACMACVAALLLQLDEGPAGLQGAIITFQTAFPCGRIPA